MRQSIECNLANDSQAIRADLIEGVASRMPRWKIEIDNIDHRNANSIEGSMVVGDIAIKIGEMFADSKRVSCSEEAAGQARRRFRRQRHRQRFVTNHVKKHSAVESLRLFGIAELVGKMPAAIKAIGFGKILERFFTIETDELSLRCECWLHSQYPCHFNE